MTTASPRGSWWGTVILLAAAVAVLYGVQGNAEETARLGASALGWMVRRWGASGGDMSHAWVIPLVSAYVVWRRRAALAEAAASPNRWGYLLVIATLLLHVAGVRAQLTRVSLFSLVALLWAVPFTLHGWAAARLLLFPAAYLLFCIPFSFLDSMTVPLRILASGASTVLLNGLGIASAQSGTAVYSAAGGGFNFDVADACSGLRSILAMTALTAAYAQFTQRGWWRQWLLFLSSVPLAIVGNIVRIVSIALVAQFFGAERAMVVYHDYSAYIVFVTAISLMMGLGHAIRPRGAGRPG